MATEDELPLIRACYDFLVWLVPKVGKFPRDLRFTLGERVERQAFLTLELLIRAKYTRSRIAILDQANTELEVLRFQLRLARDLRAFPERAYWQAAEHVTQIGQQIGGWRKQSQRKVPPNEPEQS